MHMQLICAYEPLYLYEYIHILYNEYVHKYVQMCEYKLKLKNFNNFKLFIFDELKFQY